MSMTVDPSPVHPQDALVPGEVHDVRLSALEAWPAWKTEPKDPHEGRVFAAIQRTRLLAPLLVDQHNRVLDGALRVRFARKHKLKEMPVRTVHVTEQQALYLRYVLNKSAEFQRWDFAVVDRFLGSHLEDLATLEPLGFFGENVLPESFFAKNIAKYATTGNSREQYLQEPAVEEWANLARQRRWKKPREHFKPASFEALPLRYGTTSLSTVFTHLDVKKPYWEVSKALKRAIGLTGFLEPIIVSTDGVVIDGQARLRAVEELHDEGWWLSDSVPSYTVECSRDEAMLARMVLNRSHEFHRWSADALDSFADDHPHLRPLLEPFGLYADTLLPDSAWDATALVVEPPATHETFDSKTSSLADWALLQREKYEARNKRWVSSPLRPSGGTYDSVFAMGPNQVEPVRTHDADALLAEWADRWERRLGLMTAKADSSKKRPSPRDRVPKSRVRAELPEDFATTGGLLEELSDTQKSYLSAREELQRLKTRREILVAESLVAGEPLSIVRKVSGFNTTEIAAIVEGHLLPEAVRIEIDEELQRSRAEALKRRIRRTGPKSDDERAWLELDRECVAISKKLRALKISQPDDPWSVIGVSETDYENLVARADEKFSFVFRC